MTKRRSQFNPGDVVKIEHAMFRLDGRHRPCIYARKGDIVTLDYQLVDGDWYIVLANGQGDWVSEYLLTLVTAAPPKKWWHRWTR